MLNVLTNLKTNLISKNGIDLNVYSSSVYVSNFNLKFIQFLLSFSIDINKLLHFSEFIIEFYSNLYLHYMNNLELVFEMNLATCLKWIKIIGNARLNCRFQSN